MKKQIIISALAILVGLFTLNSDGLAQGKGKGGMKNCNRGTNFVDANGDGVCDKFIDANGDGVCDTKGAGCGKGANFVDANGDGVCDNKGTGCKKGVNFVDANGDGVCDKFIDANGDGINDNCTGHSKKMGNCNKNGKGTGSNFTDSDGDGVCDHKSNAKMNNGVAFGHQNVNINLKENTLVKLNVFDSNGNLVKEIYNGQMSKGPQQIEINTDDFKSGVYFYTVEYDGKVTSKQFSVVK